MIGNKFKARIAQFNASFFSVFKNKTKKVAKNVEIAGHSWIFAV